MAGIEKRPNDYRVVWRQAGVKQWELFATPEAAGEFKTLVEAHGGKWPHGWVKGVGFGQAASTAPTFGEWAKRAIAARATANDRTRADYLRDYRIHLADPFGDTPVDRITREAVGLWLIEFSKTAKAKTVKNVQTLASTVMKDAISHGLATGNPFEGALKALPASKQEEMTFLTRGEFDTLLTRIPEHYQPLTFLLAHTGLRWSEATALRVSDVDVMAKRLRVVRAWKRTPENYYVIGEPKTRRSRRTIGITTALVDRLLPLLAGKRGSEYVFTTVQGHPVRDNNYRTRAWQPALRAAQRCDTHQSDAKPCGCPGTLEKTPRIHDLRHSHISWLIADGMQLPAIQRRAGHESITTTIDRYGHLVPDIEDEMIEAMERWAVPV